MSGIRRADGKGPHGLERKSKLNLCEDKKTVGLCKLDKVLDKTVTKTKSNSRAKNSKDIFDNVVEMYGVKK